MGVVDQCKRWARRLRALSPRGVLVLGFALFVLYGFPGYMSTDSTLQLMEARTGVYSDGHPPLMAAEWSVLDRIISGPLLMLLLQGALLLGGLYVLLQRVVVPRTAAWLAIGILLFPPVLTTMAVIWKDSQMAAYLVAGTAALVQPRLRFRIAGLGLLVAACALRHNALAAVVPLVAILFEWRPGMGWWKRLAILAATAVVTVALTFAITRVLAVQHVKLTPAFQDIVGVLAFTEDRSDEELRHVFRGTSLATQTAIQARARTLYELRGAWRVTQGDVRLLNYPQTPAEWDALGRVWMELVLGDPAAYFAYHWDGFSRMLGLSDEPLRGPVWNLFLEEPEVVLAINHGASHSRIQTWLGEAFYWLSEDTPLFRAYVYAIVALLLLVLCCRDRLTFALFTSGLLYELSFFPVAAEPDFRYSHWMITGVTIATVILFIQRRRARPS